MFEKATVAYFYIFKRCGNIVGTKYFMLLDLKELFVYIC